MHEHVNQIRVSTALSPPDLERVLKIVAEAGINIVAVGGSNLEHGGEFGFAVEDDRHQAVLDLLTTRGYKPRVVEVCRSWLTNEPGQLHVFVQEVAAENKTSAKAIQDIAIGPPRDGRVPVQIYSAPPG